MLGISVLKKSCYLFFTCVLILGSQVYAEDGAADASKKTGTQDGQMLKKYESNIFKNVSKESNGSPTVHQDRQGLSLGEEILQSLVIIRSWIISLFSISVAVLLSISTFRYLRNVMRVLSWEGLPLLVPDHFSAVNAGNRRRSSLFSWTGSNSKATRQDDENSLLSSIEQEVQDETTASTQNTSSSSDRQIRCSHGSNSDSQASFSSTTKKIKSILYEHGLSDSSGPNSSNNAALLRYLRSKERFLLENDQEGVRRASCHPSTYVRESKCGFDDRSIQSGESTESESHGKSIMKPQLCPRSLLYQVDA